MADIHSLQVFLCHASQDKAAVRDLYARLASVEGICPWLDEMELLPGQDWDFEIRKAVKASHAIIVCLSSHAVSKEDVQKEIKQALELAAEKPEGSLFLIPCRLSACDVPESLRRWQWVDVYEEIGMERLIRALTTRAASVGIIPLSQEGVLIYRSASNGDVQPFGSWTYHSSVRFTNDNIRFGKRPTDGLDYIELKADGSDSVGANKSLRCLYGMVKFQYQVLSGLNENVYFCMIPMQENSVGRTGLIEVGSNVQAHPDNAVSPFRVRWRVPTVHYGDGAWHDGKIAFDLRKTPTAFYSIFAARINEGCPSRGPGILRLGDIEAFSLE